MLGLGLCNLACMCCSNPLFTTFAAFCSLCRAGVQAMAAATAAPQVAIITTLGCPYCKKAKAAMQVGGGSIGIAF